MFFSTVVIHTYSLINPDFAWTNFQPELTGQLPTPAAIPLSLQQFHPTGLITCFPSVYSLYLPLGNAPTRPLINAVVRNPWSSCGLSPTRHYSMSSIRTSVTSMPHARPPSQAFQIAFSPTIAVVAVIRADVCFPVHLPQAFLATNIRFSLEDVLRFLPANNILIVSAFPHHSTNQTWDSASGSLGSFSGVSARRVCYDLQTHSLHRVGKQG